MIASNAASYGQKNDRMKGMKRKETRKNLCKYW